MDRRAFIGSFALGTLAVPRAARAQTVRKVYRIGILGLSPTTSDMTGPQPRNVFPGALLEGLHELGYVYGEHFVTEPRGAEGRAERYPGLVAELLRLQVDVIVAVPASLLALKQVTSTIPIVMTGAPDPVGQGFAQSLGHPGGNFTGLSNQGSELIGKRLELLKQLVPTTAPVGVVWDRSGRGVWQAAEAAARERVWKLLSLEIRDAGEIEQAFKAATDARAGAVLAASALLFGPQGLRVTEIAAKSRLPTMYSYRFYVENGGLMSYAADLIDIWRRTAIFVDKILRGAKPADLPVEQPTKFELVINLKTAKALGLTIPPSLLLRADEVIQ
jgi:putative tryptophan/tyrosine transport system substrate-binding protein